VGTEMPQATRWVKTGLFVGVEAENGVAVRLTIREGGRGYAAADQVVIPARAVGNAAPITGEVATIREETIGTVRHPDGTVDVAHSYSQWDVDNGCWPCCFRRDVAHFSGPGAEFLSLLVAACIKQKGRKLRQPNSRRRTPLPELAAMHERRLCSVSAKTGAALLRTRPGCVTNQESMNSLFPHIRIAASATLLHIFQKPPPRLQLAGVG